MTTTSNRHGSATVTLPSDTEIVITRQFDAPAAAVFKAYTTPDLVKRWWGFESSVWKVCEIDLRVGGTWRYVIEDDDMEVGFHGEYGRSRRRAGSCRPRSTRGCPTPRRSTCSTSSRPTASRR